LLIVEVEEVGHVVHSVRGLSSANHQSPITNHQSPITNQQSTITPCKTLLGSKSAVKDFWFLPGDSPLAYRPKPLDCFGESGLDGVLGGISVP
jgi:hypothetical protein